MPSSFSATDNRGLAAGQSRGRRELHLRDQLHRDGDPDARGHLAPQLGSRARQVPADEHADGGRQQGGHPIGLRNRPQNRPKYLVKLLLKRTPV